ncbi:MAG: segregation/condensation protein A [Anaerolineae bacterium]
MTDVQAPLPRAGFVVRLPEFEGPLDLLLTLIQRASLDISLIALARVTDSFLHYMGALEAIDAGEIAEFCDVAGTLMVIKSRTLLPAPPGDEPDEDADAAELLERLHAYRKLRKAAEALGQREAAGYRAYPRAAAPEIAPPPPAPGEASADVLAAFRAAMAEARLMADAAGDEAGWRRGHPVRLAERFEALRGLLLARRRLTFREVVLGGCPPGVSPREFVIVSFLALLEMLAAGRYPCVELFGEIFIEAQAGLAGVPASRARPRWTSAAAPARRPAPCPYPRR